MKKKYRKHIHTSIILLIAITVGAAILTFFYRYSERSQAANRMVEFSLQDIELMAAKGDDAALTINLASPDPISIATVLIQYPNDILEFKEIQDCGTGFQSFEPTIIPGNGFNTVAITRFSTDPKDELPSGVYCFGQMVFTAIKDGEGIIRFTPPDGAAGNWGWEIAGPDHTFEPELGSTAQVNVMVGAITPTPIPGVRLELQAAQPTVQLGQTVDFELLLNAGSSEIDAASAVIAYDPSYLQAVSITEGSAFDIYTRKNIDNTEGRILIEALMQEDTGHGVSGASNLLGTILFRSLKSGSTEVRILCNAPSGAAYPACNPNSDTLSQVSEYKKEGSGILASVLNSTLTISPISPTPTPTIPGGPFDIEVEYRVRFQGITSAPKNTDPLDTVVTLLDGERVVSTQLVPFSYHEDGVWSGRMGYNNLPTGSSYLVLIKGPKHLQKKICVVNPTELTGGMYRCNNGSIALQSGHNTLDFSSIILLAGDIPLQNGLIDAVDIAYIRSNLGKKEADIVARGDLNYDRVVDSQDYSLIINALAFKYDEEE